MIRNELSGLEYYTFENLSRFENIAHGVFTRKGGVSQGSCSGLNIGFVSNDDDSSVLQNRGKILGTFKGDKFISTKQVHGTGIYVSDGDEFKGIESDAVITDRIGEALLIKTADCQSVVLFDSEKKVVANIHSGWRGSVQNIIGKTVTEMISVYDSDPSHIIAGIGPSLGPCCSEFKNYKDEIPEKYWKYRVGENHFDFWKISISQLTDAGVKEENIETGGICTKCNPDLFYSYRFEKNTGRFGTIIMLKDK